MRKTKEVRFNDSRDDVLKKIVAEKKTLSVKQKAKALKDTRERFDKFAKQLKILGPDGEEEFKPFTWQKNLGLAFQQAYESKKKYQRNFVVVNPRQGGMTTLLCAYALWLASTKECKKIGILCGSHMQGVEKMSRIQAMYDSLPSYLKKPIKKRRKDLMEFTDGSYIYAANAYTSSVCGRTLDLVILDDAAYIRELEDFFKGYLPMHSAMCINCKTNKPQMIVTSAAKADTAFADLYGQAVGKKSLFRRARIPWNCRPGQDKAWKEKIIRDYGQEFFDREYDGKFVSIQKSDPKKS
jgi:hypothetical protein